ncbi:Os09g0124566, partial [Oryza sativa Japonica Group]
MFCRRAAASSLEILPAWTAAARAADSSLPPEPVLLPRVDCRRIPAAGAAASSPPQPVPTSAPSATAGADFPPPPAPTSSSSAAVPIPSPIPSIPIISCRSPPSTLPHNPILYQKSKTTSIGMETSCFRVLNCLP